MNFLESLQHRIEVAMGKCPADLLLLNAKVVSPFSEEIFLADIAIADQRIVALNHVKNAHTTIDMQGCYVCPSFIDAHIHIESSLLSPESFAEAVVIHGTGAVISDPHEIANVFGLLGLEYMQKASQNLPLDIYYNIPSCVPATSYETTGGIISAQDIRKAYQNNPNTLALSEMMNFPGVYLGLPDVLQKISTANELKLKIDGHAPMLSGKELNAYLNAGIFTDHECMTVSEAREKLQCGVYILIRQGSAAKNLRDLLPLLTDSTVHRIAIVSDDRHPDDLVMYGHLDHIWREMILLGVSPIRALRTMTLNPALMYGLHDRGALGIGYWADFFTVEDINKPIVKDVYHHGKKIVKDGKLIHTIKRQDIQQVMSSVKLPNNLQTMLQKFPHKGKVKTIGILPGQLITQSLIANAEDVADHDLAYLAVVERYGKTGNIGLGFVQGFGLQSGALASTVAHDNHNLILLGKNLADMELAAHEAERIGGGFIFANNGQISAVVPLPIAGLMSCNSLSEVASQLAHLTDVVHHAGVTLQSPFMVLSFLALSVIPHLKLTDMGLVDVDQFCLTNLEINKQTSEN